MNMLNMMVFIVLFSKYDSCFTFQHFNFFPEYFVFILLTEAEKNHDACAHSKYVNILNLTVTAWKLFCPLNFKKSSICSK